MRKILRKFLSLDLKCSYFHNHIYQNSVHNCWPTRIIDRFLAKQETENSAGPREGNKA